MSGLRKGWVQASIRDLCELINGKAFKPSDWTPEGLPIVRIQNLNNPNSAFNHYQGLVEEKFLIEDGQLLFAWSGTPGTSFGAHVWNGGRAVLNQHIFKVNFPLNLINKHFLRNAINQKLEELIGKAHGGAGLQHVTKGKFEDTLIYLPPLAEQNRIVAKLDALNAKSARARTELARIETLVSRYKQAVLSKAFSGELTREWRNNQANATGWSKAVISDIAEVVTGSTPKTAEKDRFFGGDTPFFKPTDLDQGYHVETPRETLSAAGVAVSRLVPADSVLVTCIGATIGKVGFARVACCTNQQINALVPNITVAKPEWLYWIVSSPEFQTIILANSSATTLPIINKRRFQQLPLGLPPQDEQHEIVRRIESAFAKIDRLAKEAKRALELVGRLDEAILAKAFRGELVPQDENDEPAEHLLARIRAEREAAPKGKRGRSAKG